MEKKRLVFLRIFLLVLVLVFSFNTILTGKAILDTEIFSFSLSTILLFVFLLMFILTFALEDTLIESEGVEEGEYEGIPYTFRRAGKGKKIALIAPGMGAENKIGTEAVNSIAEELAKKGISSISYEVQKGEEVPTLGKLTNIARLMNHVAKEKGFEDGASYMVGTSLSGYVPLIMASRLKGIKKVVLKSPLSDFADMTKEIPGKSKKKWEEEGSLRSDAEGETNLLPWKLYEQFAGRSPKSKKFKEMAKRLSEHNTGVEIVHGDKDETIPLKYSKSLYRALKDGKVDAQLDVIKGAGHNYEGGSFKKVLGKISNYLSRKK